MANCSYCILTGVPSAYGGSLVFDYILIGSTKYENTGAAISVFDKAALRDYLNSIGLGTFTVTTATTNPLAVNICVYGLAEDLDISLFGINAASSPVEITATDGACLEEDCTDCFTDILGLKEVCEPQTNFCLWLNDAGINRSTVESVMTRDYANAKEFVKEKIKIAVEDIKSQLPSLMGIKFKLNSVLTGEKLGFLQDNKISIAGTGNYGGILIDFPNTRSYLDFYTSELSLITNHTGTIPVLVYDILEGNLIDTINVNCTAGYKSVVNLKKVYASLREQTTLAFIYDTTSINSYKTLIKNGLCCGKTSCSTQYFSARGIEIAQADDKIIANVETADHTFGMSLTYSINCNHKEWMCSIANTIALPLLYKVAEKIVEHGLLAAKSQLVNTTVTINAVDLKTNHEFYARKSTEALDTVLNNIKLPNDETCFECRRVSGSKFVAP